MFQWSDQIPNYWNVIIIMCYSIEDIPCLFDDLGWPLDFNNTNQSLWNDKCDYCEPTEIKNLNLTGNNLTILQLNICSLLGKQYSHNMIKTLHKNKSLPKILLLNETHLNDSKIRHINIPNYNISYRNRPNKLGGGVAILTHKTLIYKNWLDLTDLNKDNFECVFIELTQKAKKIDNNRIHLSSPKYQTKRIYYPVPTLC